MQLSSLTLYATSPGVAIERAQLIDFLASRELIGGAISDAEFLAGDGFFDSITFLGCSPAIVLRPEEGEHPVRIAVAVHKLPKLYAHQRARPPLCITCKRPMAEWVSLIDEAQDGQIKCDACQQLNNIKQLHFRKRACYTRLVIQIQPVFESEAIPDPSLLLALKQAFGAEFKYAYT